VLPPPRRMCLGIHRRNPLSRHTPPRPPHRTTHYLPCSSGNNRHVSLLHGCVAVAPAKSLSTAVASAKSLSTRKHGVQQKLIEPCAPQSQTFSGCCCLIHRCLLAQARVRADTTPCTPQTEAYAGSTQSPTSCMHTQTPDIITPTTPHTIGHE
jgi:hypothetical protein